MSEGQRGFDLMRQQNMKLMMGRGDRAPTTISRGRVAPPHNLWISMFLIGFLIYKFVKRDSLMGVIY